MVGQAVNSFGRTIRRTESTTSRAASKETPVCRGCCMDGRRVEELAFAEGRGPDPATRDAIKITDGEPLDPLQ